MSNEKKVSIIMPVFNDAEYLERAIDSIFLQTHQNFELVICDDGSTNVRTKDILSAVAQGDTRVVLITHGENEGITKSLNDCISKASGSYIARMDGDDISLPRRLETQLAYLEEHENVDFVSGQATIINESDEVKGSIKWQESPTFKDVIEGVVFVHPAVMFRAGLLKAQPYTETELTKKGRCEDYDMWCRLYEKGYLGANVQEPIIQYRETKAGLRKRTRTSFKYLLKCRRGWYKKYKTTFKLRKIKNLKVWVQSLMPNGLYRFFHDYQRKKK